MTELAAKDDECPGVFQECRPAATARQQDARQRERPAVRGGGETGQMGTAMGGQSSMPPAALTALTTLGQ